jgi:hypothetical protein
MGGRLHGDGGEREYTNGPAFRVTLALIEIPLVVASARYSIAVGGNK